MSVDHEYRQGRDEVDTPNMPDLLDNGPVAKPYGVLE